MTIEGILIMAYWLTNTMAGPFDDPYFVIDDNTKQIDEHHEEAKEGV